MLLVPLLGAAIVVAVGWDAVLTTIHPGRDGPVSRFAGLVSWRSVRALVRATGRTGLRSWIGPSAMILNFTIWLAGLLLGFALVYLPFLDQFQGPSQPRGLVDAMYVSGVALTTVGFGDIVAGSGTFRLVMMAEAATGLAIFTAAITYLLSVYPRFIGLRSTALTISDRGSWIRASPWATLLTDGHEALKEVHGMPRQAPEPELRDGDDAHLRELLTIVDRVGSGAARSAGDAERSYREARAGADAILSVVAADRGYRHAPLLGPADDPR